MLDGHKKSLMEAISESKELDIYRTPVLMDLIDYKWNTYA